MEFEFWNLNDFMPLITNVVSLSCQVAFIFAIAEKGLNMMLSFVRGDDHVRW